MMMMKKMQRMRWGTTDEGNNSRDVRGLGGCVNSQNGRVTVKPVLVELLYKEEVVVVMMHEGLYVKMNCLVL